MKRINKSNQPTIKAFMITTLMFCCISLASGKGGEVAGLSDAFALSEAQLYELLEDYYPEEFDINEVYSQEVTIYDENEGIVFEGYINMYSDDQKELMDKSDFLFTSGDRHLYILNQ